MQPSSITSAAGTAGEGTQTVELVDGLVTETVDADGVTVQYRYGDQDTDPTIVCPPRLLCSVTHAAGSSVATKTVYRYDDAGNQTSTIAAYGTPLEAETTSVFDAAGRLLQSTGPLVGSEPDHYPSAYGYGTRGRVEWESDASNPDLDGPAGPDGHFPNKVYSYDDGDQIETITELVDYDGTGHPITTVTRNAYNGLGDLVAVTRADGTAEASTTTYAYGALGRLESVTDPAGVITQYCYDSNGNKVAEILGLAEPASCGSLTGLSATTFEYDLLGRLVAEVDPSGHRTEYRHDAGNRVTHVISAVGTDQESVVEHRYDPAGRLWQTLTPPPNEVAFDWDDPGNDALKLTEERTYTPGGRLESVSSPNPNLPFWSQSEIESTGIEWAPTATTTYSYDDAGRLEHEFSPLAILDPEDDHGPTTRVYDAAGRSSAVVSPEGRIVVSEYDLDGRVAHTRTLVDDATSLWSSVEYRYTGTGLVASESVPYHGQGDAPSGTATTTFAYRPDGALATVTDPVGAQTDYAYDARANRVRRDHYDPAGPTGNGLVQQWAYDTADRVIEQWRAPRVDPGNKHHTIAYSYDETPSGPVADIGLLRTTTDASGRTQSLDYDTSRRVVNRAYSDGTQSYTVGYGLDNAGRPAAITDSRDPGNPITQTWDLRGNLTEQTHLAGTKTWLYGADDTPVKREPTGEHLIYDLDGRLGHTFAATGWFLINLGSWHYDADDLTTMETNLELHWGTTDPPLETWGRGWERDDAGRPVLYSQQTLDVDTAEVIQQTFAGLTYDAAGRTTEELRHTTHWDYDLETLVFNRTARGYAYDPAGQLQQIIDTDEQTTLHDYAYDTHGHRLTDQTPQGTTTYTWDDIGQLSTVDRPTADDTTYTWDPAGRRATDTTGNHTLTHTWNPSGQLTERHKTDNTSPTWNETRSYDPTGVLTTIAYTDTTNTEDTTLRWDTTQPVPQLSRWIHNTATTTDDIHIFGGQDGHPIASTTRLHAQDPHGSNIDVFDPDGPYTIAGAMRFDEHGNPTTPDANLTQPTQHTYLGYRNELTTGTLIHLRNRDYDPTTATFLTPDPLDGVNGTPTVANPYHYADNDPTNKTDPTGLRPQDDDLTCEQYFAVQSYMQGSRIPAFDHCGQPRGDAGMGSPTTGKSYEEIACAPYDFNIIFGDGDWSKSDCQRAKELSEIAIARAKTEYPTAGANGTSVRNAFQHAYWNTLMTIELGSSVAEGIATNHETYNIENEIGEYKMDMRNNYVGRTIGRPLEPRFISAFEVVAQDLAASDVKAAANRKELCVLTPAQSGPCEW